MADIFKTKKEAQDFLYEKMKNCNQIQTEVMVTFADGILSQEHYSFFDFDLNGNYNASIFENKNGFQVDINFKKHSEFVLAAEVGDLNLFKEQLQKKQSANALSLAFNLAILRERLNILQFYYTEDYIKNLTLYEKPLITAAKNNAINSFQFFIRKGEQLPNEVLAQIFHNDSALIMTFLIQDGELSKEILNERFQTEWTMKGLLRKDNESTRLFKAHVSAG